MARPLKEGLHYFPFDVDFFEDEKLFDVQNEYGPLGETIYLRLLTMIYKDKGYYLEFKSLDRLSALLIRSIGNRWTRNKDMVSQVILFLVECNLFSPELMQENVLTSVGIQRRYAEVTGRRKSGQKEYWLLSDDEGLESCALNPPQSDNNPVYVDNNSVHADENATKKRKENQRKENQSKVEQSTVQAPPTLQQVQEYCKDKFVQAERFYSYYQAKGWRSGNTPISNWRAMVDVWDQQDSQTKPRPPDAPSFDVDLLERMLDIVPTL